MRCWNIYLDEVVIIEEEIGFLQCIRNLAQINGPDTQGGIFVVVEFNFVMNLGFIHVKMNIFRLKCQPPWQLFYDHAFQVAPIEIRINKLFIKQPAAEAENICTRLL